MSSPSLFTCRDVHVFIDDKEIVKGADLEMRTRLFVIYHAWEGLVFKERSAAQAKRLIKLRVELLTRP